MKEDLAPAIAALERRLVDAERKVNELRNTINVLCEEAGIPPKYPSGGGSGDGGISSPGSIAQIKSDTFYGKKLTAAMREYLEMRRGGGLGPASPREIFDALKTGGYLFESRNEGIAMVGLRAMLRKNTSVFHRLPNSGAYGLLSWYPNAKPARLNTTAGEDEQSNGDLDEKAAADDAPAAA